MILVTGASGHFGKATIDFLLKKNNPQETLQPWSEMLLKRKI